MLQQAASGLGVQLNVLEAQRRRRVEAAYAHAENRGSHRF